jgi:hypothetical protein
MGKRYDIWETPPQIDRFVIYECSVALAMAMADRASAKRMAENECRELNCPKLDEFIDARLIQTL